jgi:uncharacterized protein YcfJ
MKSPLIIRSILAVSMSMFVAGSAFADHGHRHHPHRHHSDTYVYAVYGPAYEPTYESNNYEDYGRVVDARPIYRRIAVDVPSESCGVRTVATEERRRGGDSFAGTVVGGLVGAAIGHEIGNGRGSATAVGGLIGASIGNDASKGGRTVRYRDEEVCRTEYRTEYEQRIVGYDVSYSYQGRIYKTQTDRHPGDRIAVDVAVLSRDY